MKNKIKKESIIKTALEIAPLAVQLLDPEIVSNPSVVIAKVGQAIVAHFFTKFSSEYKEKIKNGELKNGNFATEKPLLMFADLLRIIDEGKIDEERFKAMKSIFFYSVSKDATENDEMLAYELMKTCKNLSSMEIIILSANYAVVNNIGRPLVRGIEWGSKRHVGYWAQTISEKIGHNFPDIVLQFENHLASLNLISPRQFIQNNTEIANYFTPTPYFRLTPLGYKLCEFMTKYE